MRNDSHKWAPAQPINMAIPIDLGVASLTPVDVAYQTLISGPDVLHQVDAAVIGWPDITEMQSYALCLRRDRVLLVDLVHTNNAARTPGWNEATQQAISDVTDTYAVYDLSGPLALELLQRGAEISLKTTSRSVVRRLFGLEAMIYRAAGADHFRVHIEWTRQQSLVEHLQSAAALACQ